jgi:hypothetical protein
VARLVPKDPAEWAIRRTSRVDRIAPEGQFERAQAGGDNTVSDRPIVQHEAVVYTRRPIAPI